MNLMINNKHYSIEVEQNVPLLWVLRDLLGLTGTKFSCGRGLCGACTVHVDGQPVRSCVVPIGAVRHARVTTIEGLSKNNDHPVQLAWIREQVPQCGYCQPGMIMAAAGLMNQGKGASYDEMKAGMTNLCRCGTYPHIDKALRRLCADSQRRPA
ncbi:(2Fe-2S)-binding protein [Alcaligenes sp. WGS1538]|uniref:(2Fe-2S)-binding protein n=1 Tax=Alcaligenes sp. WGS1538 TaxID=3366811 RepID=UPI00372D7435